MELASLHKERLAITQKVEENEKSISYLNKCNHWHKRHLKLIDAQIEEAKDEEPATWPIRTIGAEQSSVSDLLDIAKAGLK